MIRLILISIFSTAIFLQSCKVSEESGVTQFSSIDVFSIDGQHIKNIKEKDALTAFSNALRTKTQDTVKFPGEWMIYLVSGDARIPIMVSGKLIKMNGLTYRLSTDATTLLGLE